MAIDLSSLRVSTASKPPRIVIHGPPGLGKTTLANEFPEAVFVQTEEGENAGMNINTFGLLTTFEEVMEALTSLDSDEHEFKTVVLDSLDKLEPLVWKFTCKENSWDSVESPGYGKGYVAADEWWRELVGALNVLRNKRSMNIVLIAHSTVDRFDDPRTASYSKFEIRLHKRAKAIIEDEVDLIAFLNQEATVKEEDAGFNKKRTHAEGGNQRWIYVEQKPSMNAKNRYNMPPKLLFKKGEGYAALAKYFPGEKAAEKKAA